MRWTRARATDVPPVAGRGRPAVLMAVALLLICATVAWFTWVQRYEPAGQPLLAIEDGLDSGTWRIEGPAEQVRHEASAVVLDGGDGEAWLRVVGVTAVDPRGATLRLAATVSGEGLARGQGRWAGARVYLVGLDARGEPVWTRRHELARLAGDAPPSPYEANFVVPPRTPAVMVGIEHGYGQGVLRVHGLDLRPMAELADFEVGRRVLLGLWAGYGLWLLLATAGGFRVGRVMLVVPLVALPVVVAVAMPETQRGMLVALVRDRLGLELGFEQLGHIGHALLFALLGAGIAWSRPFDVPGHQLLALWLLAVALEVLQVFAMGRLALAEDAVVNLAGVTLGFALVQGPRALLARRAQG